MLEGGAGEGHLVCPTVVRDSTDEMLGMREEVFGPVAFTSSFSTAEEVLARAQNHKYGIQHQAPEATIKKYTASAIISNEISAFKEEAFISAAVYVHSQTGVTEVIARGGPAGHHFFGGWSAAYWE